MNLFARKVHTVCMCNLIVPFVCTGFLGIKTNNGIITGSTTDEAHEISLTASDTEPVSQYGEGEENSFAFITEGVEALIDQQEFTGPLPIQGEENDFAFITEGVKAIINQQEKALETKKENKKVENKKTTKKTTTKKTTTNTTSSTVAKKEVASGTYEKPSSSNATGEAIVNYAKKFKGLRYSSGKQSLSSGADCSGFTMLIYREFGISLPRNVSGQMKKGKAVSKNNLQKGDLVFFKPKGCKSCGASHVSIYIGGGQVIHETRPGRGVAITGIDGLSNIQFIGARRIINSGTAKVTETKKEENKTDTAINVTPTPTSNINIDEKNENINSVVENTTVSATPTSTTTPKENTANDVKEDVKVEVTPSVSNESETVNKVEPTPVPEKTAEVKKDSPLEEESN